ncbi:MAG: hypothetical protein GEU78_06710 [Actinobacteria bacterium]|nr:hypothetical protein [Actinomycetota bacterium]
MDPPGPDIDALFASPLEDFIAERDRLAGQLSASGSKDAARSVKSLRKPSVVVWALNQLARSEPDRLQALFETGESMRLALERGDPRATREAQTDRRSHLKQLGGAAGRILGAAGHATSSGHVDKVRSILLQATTDQDMARSISEGRLTVEPTPGALPDVFDSVPPPSGDGGDERAEDERASRRRARREQRVEALRSGAESASQEAARLAREAESARLAADAAEDVATAAQRAADRALRHLEDAERELRDQDRPS